MMKPRFKSQQVDSGVVPCSILYSIFHVFGHHPKVPLIITLLPHLPLNLLPSPLYMNPTHRVRFYFVCGGSFHSIANHRTKGLLLVIFLIVTNPVKSALDSTENSNRGNCSIQSSILQINYLLFPCDALPPICRRLCLV